MPPIPEPFPLPPPGEGMLDFSPLWDINNLIDMVRAFRTIFALVDQNYVFTVAIGMCLILLAVAWMASFVGSRDETI